MYKLIGTGLRALLTTSALLAVMLVAGTAFGLSTAREYGELLTSDDTWFHQQDITARVDLAATGLSAFDAESLGIVTAGGLGDGYMSSFAARQYDHVFAPTQSVSSITYASLSIGFHDDEYGDGLEFAFIWADYEFLTLGQSTWSILENNVAAKMFKDDKTITVTVFALGDTVLDSSYFNVGYQTGDGVSAVGGGVSPMPEPGGVTLFYVGLIVFGTARSRMRSRQRR
ncbi:MAG: hypothetical protein JRG92_19095 [Deltaproteobacteria bacterium]|nr:hypothetical protein [Deltaproteobacteria bacterium]